MSAKWRLLEVGEELCGGDEFWWDRWRPVATDDVPDGVEVGMPLSDRAGPHRRRMTPAEEHAEELLMHLKEMHDWFEEGHRHHFSIGSIGEAISKAERRQP